MSSTSTSPMSLEDYSAYYDLGTLQRPITTTSKEAQAWFNHGWIWCIAFNHEEAIICFKNAILADPQCVMAHWGVAYAMGPNYNIPLEAHSDEELKEVFAKIDEAIIEAKKSLENVTEVEKALVEALEFRYPKDKRNAKEFNIWNAEYASAMENVYERFNNDLDVVTLYADALMNMKPWGLWDLRTGKPTDGAEYVYSFHSFSLRIPVSTSQFKSNNLQTALSKSNPSWNPTSPPNKAQPIRAFSISTSI